MSGSISDYELEYEYESDSGSNPGYEDVVKNGIYNSEKLENFLYVEDESTVTIDFSDKLFIKIFGDEIVIDKGGGIRSGNEFGNFIVKDIINICDSNTKCIVEKINNILKTCFMCYKELPVNFEYTKPTIRNIRSTW